MWDFGRGRARACSAWRLGGGLRFPSGGDGGSPKPGWRALTRGLPCIGLGLGALWGCGVGGCLSSLFLRSDIVFKPCVAIPDAPP